jgi:hypothetical protein
VRFNRKVAFGMTTGFHETFAQGEVKPPTDRATGGVFAVVALIVATLWRNSPLVPWVALTLAVALAAASLVYPTLLRPLNWVWFRFGLLLHRVMNPLIMFVIFAVVFVPGGLLMRIWHDPLRSRRAAGGASYWIDRQKNNGSMANQF